MKDVLNAFNNSLKMLENMKSKLLSDLSPEQRIKYENFERELFELTNKGDVAGAEKLKENFKNKFDDKL